MLCNNALDAVLAFAMAKYAAENDGKKGISKNDVVDLVKLHGGSTEDIEIVMVRAIEYLMPDGVYLN